MLQQTILTLLLAIRIVESADGIDVSADGNDYQITKVCVEDVNRIYGTRYVWPQDVKDRETAENIIMLYLTYYGMMYKRDFGKVPSSDTLAKIYHCGYRGMKRNDREGRRYVSKIRKATLKRSKRK